MASRWRCRRMCILVSGEPAGAALRNIDATGAFLETNARPLLGELVQLHHPDAGSIGGTVTAIAHDGIRIGFDYGEQSVAFALAAIVADMSRPAAA